MLTSLGIANFKAFGPALQSVPLRPITLVFGPNSSGKSSIIQSLLLLNHAAASRDADLTGQRTTLGGDSVDLGGFWQYLHGRGRKEGEVLVTCDLTPPVSFKFRSQFLRTATALRLELTISARSRSEAPRLSVCRALVDGALLYQIVQPTSGTIRLNTWETDHPVSKAVEENSLKINTGFKSDTGAVDVFREAVLELLDTLTLRADDGLLPYEFNTARPEITNCQTEADTIKDKSPGIELNRAVRLSVEQNVSDVLRDFRDLFTDSLNKLEYLGPLRKLPRRHLADDDLLSDRASGAFAWKAVMENTAVRERVNLWLGNKSYMQTPYRLEVHNLVHVDEPSALEAIRKGIESSLARLALGEDKFGETIVGDWIDDHYSNLAYDLKERILRLHGEFTDMPYSSKLELLNRHPSLLELVVSNNCDYYRDQIRNGEDEDDGEVHDEAWVEARARDISPDMAMGMDPYAAELCKFYVSESGELQQLLGEMAGSESRVKEFSQNLIRSDHDRRIDLRLIDIRSETAVTHRDVGVGISQVLPVLVHAYADKDKLIAIEQPEIHIHPALQAELGDVFIESAMKQGNIFLIETHSEHLILRLLRRIRETSAGENADRPPLTPADVAVLYVEPGEDGSRVIEIPIGPDGDFDRPWPNGFFAERGKELF